MNAWFNGGAGEVKALDANLVRKALDVLAGMKVLPCPPAPMYDMRPPVAYKFHPHLVYALHGMFSWN